MTRVSKEKASDGVQESRTVAPLMSDDSLRMLYARMLKCRMVTEARARWLMTDQVHRASLDSALGLEATEAATVLDLIPNDTIVPASRAASLKVATGAPLKFAPKQPSPTKIGKVRRRKPRQHDDSGLHIIAPISRGGTSLPVAAGLALAYKLLKRRNVVVAFADEFSGTIESLDKTLNYAAAHKLPIVCVILSGASETSFSRVASSDPNLMPTIVVDGNDPVAVYRVAHEAIDHARSGGGPTIIDCRTKLWYVAQDQSVHPEHPDAIDPLPHLERYLRKRGLWSVEWNQSLIADYQHEIREATGSAETAPADGPGFIPAPDLHRPPKSGR